VPPGIQDGALLRLGGMGKRIGELRRGDLYLKIKVAD
jgi:DnaJ-class molecular chaperone